MSKMKKRKVIVSNLHGILGENLDTAISYLMRLKVEHEDDYESLELEFEIDSGYYDEPSSMEVYLIGIRNENATEEAKRLKQKKVLDERTEKSDRQNYERLKKRFEKQEHIDFGINLE